tara:strand:+ start:29474 stop:29722 length:249 start_codon:yes stop_codon:yes gene_type:complete
MKKRKDHNLPQVGDLVACCDGDLGLVLNLEYGDDSELLIRVMWKSGDQFLDPWSSRDFIDGTGMFSIASEVDSLRTVPTIIA